MGWSPTYQTRLENGDFETISNDVYEKFVTVFKESGIMFFGHDPMIDPHKGDVIKVGRTLYEVTERAGDVIQRRIKDDHSTKILTSMSLTEWFKWSSEGVAISA